MKKVMMIAAVMATSALFMAQPTFAAPMGHRMHHVRHHHHGHHGHHHHVKNTQSPVKS
jgi:hypothetical protein